MIENNMYCQEHQENKIINVCIANHKCQRKLCYECENNHQNFAECLISVSEFSSFLEKQIKNQINQGLEQTFQLKMVLTQFNQQLEQLRDQFQESLNDTIKQMKEIIDEIDEGDQNYQRLLNFYNKATEISQIDLELIINAIKNNKLEQWNIYKDSLKTPLLETNQNVESYLKDLKLIMIEKLQVVNKLKGDINQNQNKNWQIGIVQTKGRQEYFELSFLGYQFQKTYFFIEQNNQQEITYIKDGVKLAIQSSKNKYKSQNVIRNLDQVRYLQWIQKKNGEIYAHYDGECFQSGGYCNKKGQKIGCWIDLFENFCRCQLAFYKGKYNNGKKEGIWDILSNTTIIGCGVYDNDGQKNGLWVDLHQNHSRFCNVIDIGQYQNGQRIGKWETFYKDQIIGGGTYNKKGMKIGKWIILHNNFQDLCEITFSGEYRGRKIGKWDTIYESDYNNLNRGGGFYDYKGKKLGKWIELNDNFKNFCYVLFEGNYEVGRKQGVWNLYIKHNQMTTKIGEGYYNNFGIKHGKWVEPCKYFGLDTQILLIGSYDNGIKKDLWVAYYKNDNDDEFKEIGGGSYDQDGRKTGKWKELHENFCGPFQIIYEGNYENGKKQHRWDIMHKDKKEQVFQLIGGGVYDEDGMKHGQWIELSNQYSGINDSLKTRRYNHGLKENRLQNGYIKNLDVLKI